MIQVVNRAIDIIEYIAISKNQPIQLGEISKALQLNNGTCANIIKTLVNRGYLEKVSNQGGYLLGNQLLNLSEINNNYQELIEASAPMMQKITEALGENTLLAIIKGDKRNVLYKKFSNQLIQANTPDEKKAYDSSTGRLLLAMMTDGQLQKFIDKYGLPSNAIWAGASNKKSFWEQINIIRENGYALIEDSVQVIGIACAIYQHKKAIASLSIYMPAFRFTNVIRDKMIKTCITSAKKITILLNKK